MRQLSVIILCLFCLGVVFADEPQVFPKNVLDVVTADWNDDGGFDRAVLITTEQFTTELFLYLSDFESDDMLLALHLPDVAWTGTLWGTVPSLHLNDFGALQIYSENSAIGRNRWNQTLTAIYKEGAFIIETYSYSAYDTLDLDYELNCELNFLAGESIKNSELVTFDPQQIRLKDISSNYYPELCHNDG